MTNIREDGFYWVKLKGESEYFVAMWGTVNEGDTNKFWQLPGLVQPLEDDDLSEISERLVPPSKSEIMPTKKVKRIITHVNCPTPAHSGKDIGGGSELGSFPYSLCWPCDSPKEFNKMINPKAEFGKCEGCRAIIAVSHTISGVRKND